MLSFFLLMCFVAHQHKAGHMAPNRTGVCIGKRSMAVSTDSLTKTVLGFKSI